MALVFVIKTGKFHTYNILDCYLPMHLDICFLHIFAPLLENELNQEGIM